MLRNYVYRIVDSERDYQDRKWGTIEMRGHEVGAWLLIMENALRQAKEVWASASNDDAALEELRKLIGIGVACAEQHGLRPRHHSELKHPMRDFNPITDSSDRNWEDFER